MDDKALQIGETRVVAPGDFQVLLDELSRRGYTTLGPTVSEGVIAYAPLKKTEQLPIGWSDYQDAGCYRLVERKDRALFGYVVGPHSWKKFTFPSSVELLRFRRDNGKTQVIASKDKAPKYAFIGVRPCELQALRIHDDVLIKSRYSDSDYAARRKHNFIVTVNCFEPAGTCFCTSMNTGPVATEGFDLGITEVCTPQAHFLLIETGSGRGAEVLSAVPGQPATDQQRNMARDILEAARKRIRRTMQLSEVKDLLHRQVESNHWEEVGKRCLSCTNCTMVCPTCFCTSIEDSTDLAGTEATRTRKWDSCFNEDYSYIHGGSVRTSPGARYRQWITHKLATWQDQFGQPGCVGCGRCITWCPVGIDITEEIAALQSKEKPSQQPVGVEE